MNDNHALTAENLLASLPQVLQDDDSMAALAYSIAAVLEKRMNEINAIAVYTRIDELPEGLLDILAQDFKVDWWDASYSVEEKREMLKNSWHVHRILGTKEAVATAIAAICTDFNVREWWEYGGDPGCFMVQTSNFKSAFEYIDQILTALEKVKRLSAHLDSITIAAENNAAIGIAIATQSSMVHTMQMSDDVSDLESVVLTDENNAVLTDENGSILTV